MAYEPEKGGLARLMKWFLIATVVVVIVNVVIAYMLIN